MLLMFLTCDLFVVSCCMVYAVSCCFRLELMYLSRDPILISLYVTSEAPVRGAPPPEANQEVAAVMVELLSCTCDKTILVE